MNIRVVERDGWTFVNIWKDVGESMTLKANSTKTGCDLAREIAASVERHTDTKVHLSGLSM